MELGEMSYSELIELYVALLEQIAENTQAKAPKAVIDPIRNSQLEVRNELEKRRRGR